MRIGNIMPYTIKANKNNLNKKDSNVNRNFTAKKKLIPTYPKLTMDEFRKMEGKETKAKIDAFDIGINSIIVFNKAKRICDSSFGNKGGYFYLDNQKYKSYIDSDMQIILKEDKKEKPDWKCVRTFNYIMIERKNPETDEFESFVFNNESEELREYFKNVKEDKEIGGFRADEHYSFDNNRQLVDYDYDFQMRPNARYSYQHYHIAQDKTIITNNWYLANKN